MKFSQVNSLSELFTFWGNKADKYTALNRLREYYDEQKDILMEPYYRELFKYAEKYGAESITAERYEILCIAMLKKISGNC